MAKIVKSTKSIIEESREIISCLEEIDNQEKRLLGNLQNIRALEKIAIKKLKAANEARDQYLQDADWNAYVNAIDKIAFM